MKMLKVFIYYLPKKTIKKTLPQKVRIKVKIELAEIKNMTKLRDNFAKVLKRK